MAGVHNNVQVPPGPAPQAKRSLLFRMLKILGVVGSVVLLWLYVAEVARQAFGRVHRNDCKNHLKQIGLALHNYHEKYNALPPAYTVDANGKPLHSWRTLILPFLIEGDFYKTIDLSKPWNDPANAAANAAVIREYQCPFSGSPATMTTYLAVVTPHSGLRAIESQSFPENTDGLSNTLLVLEVPTNRAVHWMSPLDADENLVLSIGPQTKLAHEKGSNALLADGAVRFISADLPAAQRLALISVAGNEAIGEY